MDGLKEFNVNDAIDALKKYSEHEEITLLIESFQNENYEDTINYINAAKKYFENDAEITDLLLLFELLCDIQLDKEDPAKIILQTLYGNILDGKSDTKNLFVLGELATLVDQKMARKILSHVVKLLEENPGTASLTLGNAYLLLADVEEKMSKLPRAIKYYEQGIAYLIQDNPENALLSFLYYKTGILQSALGKNDEAIAVLEKGLALANEQEENKIHILVSMGKVYTNMEDKDKAFSNFSEALELIEHSKYNNKFIHAEALTELAYYYFETGQVDKALPFYEKAIKIYENEKDVQTRKLGMICMQYAYSLEHKEEPDVVRAALQYENGLRYLEQSGDQELYANAVMDVVNFFTTTNNKKKKRFYENKLLKLSNNRM